MEAAFCPLMLIALNASSHHAIQIEMVLSTPTYVFYTGKLKHNVSLNPVTKVNLGLEGKRINIYKRWPENHSHTFSLGTICQVSKIANLDVSAEDGYLKMSSVQWNRN